MTKKPVEKISGCAFQNGRIFHGEPKNSTHWFFCKEQSTVHKVDGADLKASEVSINGSLATISRSIKESRYCFSSVSWGRIKISEVALNRNAVALLIANNLKGARVWTKNDRIRVYHQKCFVDLSHAKEIYGANDDAIDPQRTIPELQDAYQKAIDRCTVAHLVFCTEDYPDGAPAHRLPLLLEVYEYELDGGVAKVIGNSSLPWKLVESRDILSGDAGSKKLTHPIAGIELKQFTGKNLLWMHEKSTLQSNQEILFAGLPVISMILKEIYQRGIGVEVPIEYLSKKAKRCCKSEQMPYIFRSVIKLCSELGIIAPRRDPNTKMYTSFVLVSPSSIPFRGQNIDVYAFLGQHRTRLPHQVSA